MTTHHLARTTAAVLGRTLGLPADVASGTYTGTPDVPSIRVRLVAQPVQDAHSGLASATVQVAAYGAPLALGSLVDGDGRIAQRSGLVDAVGTLTRLHLGTIATATLPDGTHVEYAHGEAEGYAWLPTVGAPADNYTLRSAVTIVSAGLDDRLAWAGGRHVGFATSNVQDVSLAPDGRTVTGSLLVTPGQSCRLTDLRVPEAAEAAASAAVGTVVPYLGRIMAAEVGRAAPTHDDRTTSLVLSISLTIGAS